MTSSTQTWSTDPYAKPETDLVDSFGHIETLRPPVIARAKRVVAKTHGEHPLDELLDILGLTEATS